MGLASIFRYTAIEFLTSDRLGRVPLIELGPFTTLLAYKVHVNSKVHPRTGYEGPGGGSRCTALLFL